MATKSLDNAFYVEDMTSLRYAIPFIKAAKKLLDKRVHLVYNEGIHQHKYNSIQGHMSRFLLVCQENEVEAVSYRDLVYEAIYARDFEVGSLFCVENVAKKIKCNKYYSFQHGFDYSALHKNEPNATYLVTEEHFKNDLNDLGVNALIQPIPLVFWDWDSYVEEMVLTNPHFKDGKIATLFYPEEGLEDLFRQVQSFLKSKGYKTYIKQRSKNQSVPSRYDNVFYDWSWYPTESIFLPMLADFSVGFGTSAYTDLVHLDRDFIDLSVPDYSRTYYKPQRKNLISILDSFYENFCKVDLRDVTLQEKLRDPCDYQKIKEFLAQVLT
jgi:hypothetical protein